MKLYFAPLEGITTYTYRNVHNEMFGMCDAYFAPFINPSESERLSAKNMRNIMPENNTVCLKVQCLSNSEKAFVDFTKSASELGYDEVNLNLGCPSGTVVNKNRGSGVFKDLNRLNTFLEYIFSNSACDISVKTRTGFYSHNEFKDIIKIYNQYPIKELIVHPRIREDFYNGKPNLESFDLAYYESSAKLCYNGDIFNKEDYERIALKYPDLNSIMIGRGAIGNPAIFREINGGRRLSTNELIAFSNELEKRYMLLFKSETNTLCKLKEVWEHQLENYPEEKKIAKAIKKCKSFTELNNAINSLPEISA